VIRSGFRAVLADAFSPFDCKWIDRILIALFLFSIYNTWYFVTIYQPEPAPSFSSSIVKYLLLEDGTACYSNNTKENREAKKHNDYIRKDTFYGAPAPKSPE
jgi:hypothetical protein